MPLGNALQISAGRQNVFQGSELSMQDPGADQGGSLYGTDNEMDGHDQGYEDEDMDEPVDMEQT